jgi:hypothetical protein
MGVTCKGRRVETRGRRLGRSTTRHPKSQFPRQA